MGRSRVLVAAIVVLGVGISAPGALGASGFHPRIGRAMGLVAPLNRQHQGRAGDVTSGALTPVTYHGGPVMAGGVTVHTIFWAASGYAFEGSPGPGIPTYEGLIQQFFSDVAANSAAPGMCTTSECNAFTVERQYAQGTALGQVIAGSYAISYNATADTINAADPYPSKAAQCASPAGAAVCLTDSELTAEVDHVVQSTGGGRGLHNLWFVFLPPGVDECITPGDCGTSTFAGYHAVANVDGHGATIYALAIDPATEGLLPPGADPQGYPDAEATLITAAHEVNEAVTDPEGNGWMDPNGFEVGDKCENGPQTGSPLGFAANGSPYNQVINGHRYLLQEEWANFDSAGNADCVQATTATQSGLPLPQVFLHQFDPWVTGNVNRTPGGGIHVRVSIVRAGAGRRPIVVARRSTTTRPDGSWRVWLWPHAPGDDRDQIDIDYSGVGAPQPSHQVILTGNGGNPFIEAGWMGWLAMDNGSALTNNSSGSSLALAPCFQAGTITFAVNRATAAQAVNDFCNTETNAATVDLARVKKRDSLSWTSNDNRAFEDPTSPAPNLFGGLVSLTVPIGEAGSVSTFTSALPPFEPTGFPTCTADLELRVLLCNGLVPRKIYIAHDRRRRGFGIADATGTVAIPMRFRHGDSVRLSNGSRTLTTLHVAKLRVKILGEEATLAGGTCQPGDYFGPPLSKVPTSAGAGLPTPLTTDGVALTGRICPMNGHARGLSATNIVQTDELSGGQTETEVPVILDTTPIEGETMYGPFTALAQSGLALSGGKVLRTDRITRISLRIETARGATVQSVRNVDRKRGVQVSGLRPGSYNATWKLTDVNGDTRVVITRFIEAPGSARRVR